MHRYVNEILQYIRDQFVEGKVSTAKNLVCDCVTVTQNRHCITMMDRATYCEYVFMCLVINLYALCTVCVHVIMCASFCSPQSLLYERNKVCRYMTLSVYDTDSDFCFLLNREVFRQLFGSPNDKKTYMKVCQW